MIFPVVDHDGEPWMRCWISKAVWSVVSAALCRHDHVDASAGSKAGPASRFDGANGAATGPTELDDADHPDDSPPTCNWT